MIRRNFLKFISLIPVVGIPTFVNTKKVFVAGTIYNGRYQQYRTILYSFDNAEAARHFIDLVDNQPEMERFTLVKQQTNLDPNKIHGIEHNMIDGWKDVI